MLGMQQVQHHPHQMAHHVPTSYPPLATPSGTSPSCAPISPIIKSARPKLTLNTAVDNTQARTLGKGTSLRLDTLSAISPTIRNTFSNAYEPKSAPVSNPTSLKFEFTPPQDETPIGSQSSDISSAASSSTVSLESAVCPYIQPSHLKPILVNSHYPRIPVRRMSVQRPMFPLEKSVSFREPLDEEIKTTKYILAHSDLDAVNVESSLEPAAQTEEPQSTSLNDENISVPQSEDRNIGTDTDLKINTEIELQIPPAPTSLSSPTPPSPPLLSLPRSSPRIGHRPSHSLPTLSSGCPRKSGHKRDSSSSGSESDDSRSHTPVAGRSKRTRWAWTLGPLPGYKTPDDNTLEVPMGSREGSVIGDDLSLSPGSNPSP
jgi:hypothetical protein